HGGPRWFARYEHGFLDNGHGAAESLLRLAELGPHAGMEMAAVMAIRAHSTTEERRRTLSLWLAHRWMTLANIEPMLRQVIGYASDQTKPHLGLALVVRGADDIPDEIVELMAQNARTSRTAFGRLLD